MKREALPSVGTPVLLVIRAGLMAERDATRGTYLVRGTIAEPDPDAPFTLRLQTYTRTGRLGSVRRVHLDNVRECSVIALNELVRR